MDESEFGRIGNLLEAECAGIVVKSVASGSLVGARAVFVETRGIEPLTSTLQR